MSGEWRESMIVPIFKDRILSEETSIGEEQFGFMPS